MNVKLAYGRWGLDLSLPEGLNVDVVQPQYVEAAADPAGAVRDALRGPMGSRPLKDLVKPSDTVAIICNDVTRATPYRTILPALLDELGHVRDSAIVLLIATGTHRPCTIDELGAMLGEQVVRRLRIVQNDARDRGTHALAGTTTGGNEVWLHKEYLRCDVRILTGFIEPHFFAGFSGGGKACMPGMAGLETILRNHSERNIDHPAATWGVTQGNPVWEGIQEAALIAPSTFLLNVALNRDKEITAVFAGDLERAHEQGCAFVKQQAMVGVDMRYDVVVTTNSGYPLDLNLYQSVKGMSAAARIAKEGGAIIVAADCEDGIPDHGWYKRLLFEADSPASLLRMIRSGDCRCQDAWQAQIHAAICCKHDVHLFSRHLTDEEIELAMLTPCHDIARTVDGLLRRYGPDASVCLLPEGPQTIPYVATERGL
ncbi:MAG: nickel-dependent lactate racemase [Sedimentisphaerales bacterium]|nr:nickel-dependent lactate racemase [Sedimentisphaerales bacterium]